MKLHWPVQHDHEGLPDVVELNRMGQANLSPMCRGLKVLNKRMRG